MKKTKKACCFFIVSALILLFIFLPLPAADMTIRIQLAEIPDNNYTLYYSKNGAVFTPDQCIAAEIDYDRNHLVFRLDGSLEGLRGLRLDFPDTDALICVENITVSSAGIIQRQFNPTRFFAEENRIATNDFAAISVATAQDKVYFLPGGSDPYIVISDSLVKWIDSGYSHLSLSRFAICLFAAGCLFFFRKNYFA